MWIRARSPYGGIERFFYLSLRGSNLKAYYSNMFTLIHQYKYTLTELENMIPWERDLYIGMVNLWVKDEEEKIKKRLAQQEQATQRTLSAIKSRRR